MTGYNDTTAGEWGTAAERIVRRWYQQHGSFVVPIHAIEDGGAPYLAGLLRKHVLPDFQVSKAGFSRWVEVKYKDHCVLYQKAQEWRHGIDLPNWQDYLQVETETGIPGYLAILQYRKGPGLSPDPLLLEAAFAALQDVTQEDPARREHARRGMVYWPVSAFGQYPLGMSVSRLELLPRLTRIVHPWERPGKNGTVPNMDAPPRKRIPDGQDALFPRDWRE
jgi:hypothetical protein